MTPYELVQHEATTLPPGAQVRVNCPKCGDTNASLSIRQTEEGPHWKCFRASCGYTGGRPRGQDSLFVLKNEKSPRYYTYRTRTLAKSEWEFLDSKFGFVPTPCGFAPDDDRYVLEVLARRGWGNGRGVLAYSFTKDPKVLTYNERPAEPFLHWAGQSDARHIVVVEDWFSAEKVGLTGRAAGVALLGTHLDQSMVYEIAVEARSKMAATHIALDKDAYGKAVNYLHRFAEQFPNGLDVWALDRDLKYVDITRINEGLDGRTEFTRETNTGSGDGVEGSL